MRNIWNWGNIQKGVWGEKMRSRLWPGAQCEFFIILYPFRTGGGSCLLHMQVVRRQVLWNSSISDSELNLLSGT